MENHKLREYSQKDGASREAETLIGGGGLWGVRVEPSSGSGTIFGGGFGASTSRSKSRRGREGRLSGRGRGLSGKVMV